MTARPVEISSLNFARMAMDMRAQYFDDKGEIAQVLTMAVVLGSFTGNVLADGVELEGYEPDALKQLAIDVIAYACALRLADLDIIGSLELVPE